jgi:hypothetical protein
MKIAYAAVDGGMDYSREAQIDHLGRADRLLATVDAVAESQTEIDLLVFPAGYFQLSSAEAMHGFAADLTAQLAGLRPAFGVVWGTDVHARAKPRSKPEHRPDDYPYFASYRSAAGELVTFQQITATATQGGSRDIDDKWGDRPLLLPGTNIALLICGECWSQKLLARVAKPDCRALVVTAHRNVKMHRDPGGYGRLSWHLRLDNHHRSSGVPIVLSEHTRSPDRHPYAWPAKIAAPLVLDSVPPSVTLRLATIPVDPTPA